MKSIIAFLLAVTLTAGCASKPAAGPEALTGTWTGHWGPTPERQTEVQVDLKWDGSNLTGTIDPARRSLQVKKGSFDGKTNAVHMEVDAPANEGEPDHYTIDGKVDGKTMQGTWTRRNGSG